MTNNNYGDLMWYWNNIPINITKLNTFQLIKIRSLINSNRNKEWFNIKNDIWLKTINRILKQQDFNNIVKITKEIENRRVERVNLLCNYITNNMIKSSNITLSIKQL